MRDWFYRPKIKDNMRHFVSRVCRCVKSKNPRVVTVAPMKSISSSAPLELIGLNFLVVETTNIFKFSQITSHVLCKCMQPLKNLPASCLYNDFNKHINELVHAYNYTKHSTTGSIPYYLMFGWSSRLPIPGTSNKTWICQLLQKPRHLGHIMFKTGKNKWKKHTA